MNHRRKKSEPGTFKPSNYNNFTAHYCSGRSMKRDLAFLWVLISFSYLVLMNGGCAQIGFPTGGFKDTIPPVLLKADPELNAISVTRKKITLSFNEYVEVQELQNNLLISPIQKVNPTINNNLKTITIAFKDSLLPNTTYSINFGNSIRDINEGNIYKDFTYLFSTGPYIDSLTLSGKVTMAESGKTDSTLSVLLYADLSDSAVLKSKPNYMTRISGDGSFTFRNLPAGTFNIYALKDANGSRTYDSKAEPFAFLDSSVQVGQTSPSVSLFASTEEKVSNEKVTVLKRPFEKKLRIATNLVGQSQSLLEPLFVYFINPIQRLDSQAIQLTDSGYASLLQQLTLDSTRKTLKIETNWKPGEVYNLLINKDGIADSAGNQLSKSDTISFTAKSVTDYGRVLLRFKNLDLARHPVLQFLQGEEVKLTYIITDDKYVNNLFPPGEYDLRIVIDANQNGILDPGKYSQKIQPERGTVLPQKLSIRADWDNERDITF